MPQIENKDLLGTILRSTIGVISRRTSEAYALVVVGTAIKTLGEKYIFLNYVKIQNTQFHEISDVVEINDSIKDIEVEDMGTALNEFVQNITVSMGKDAGYYFIKEIKEDLPYDHETKFKEVGFDLDYLQLDFITKIRQNNFYEIQNSEILKHIITILFELMDKDSGRIFAYETLNELINRLSTQHDVLKYVKINDIRSIQGIDVVAIDKSLDTVDSNIVGAGIQKIIQEANNAMQEKGSHTFLENLKNWINADYNIKLRDMGVDLSVIKLKQELVVKHVLRSLVDILSDASTQSYAVLMVNNAIKSFELQYGFLRAVEIDSLKYAHGDDAVAVPEEINEVRASDLGRSLQRIIENISISMGEDAGKNFVKRFRKRLGKAYVLRVEELGVNLHMIELRNNMMF